MILILTNFFERTYEKEQVGGADIHCYKICPETNRQEQDSNP